MCCLLLACSGTTIPGATIPGATVPRASSTTVAEASEIVAVLDCTAPIGTADPLPPGQFEPIADAVALQTSATNTSALQTGATGDPDPQRRLFAKTALFLRGGERSEIVVPPEWRGRARVWWGNTGGGLPADRFVAGPCDTDHDGWIVFPGGITVAAPACIDLTVEHAGTDTRVSMGVGAPCAGQRPPDQPSDT